VAFLNARLKVVQHNWSRGNVFDEKQQEQHTSQGEGQPFDLPCVIFQDGNGDGFVVNDGDFHAKQLVLLTFKWC
jgi:hypothetical protein